MTEPDALRDDVTPGEEPAPRVVRLLQVNGRGAWQLVGIIVAIGLLGFIFSRVQLILFAVFVALVHTAIITPVARWFEDRGLGRQVAAALGLVVVVVGLGGATALVGYRIVDQLPDVIEDVRGKRGVVMDLLRRPPIGLTEDEVAEVLDRGVSSVAEGAEGDAPGAATSAEGAGDVGEAVTGEATEEPASADDGVGPSPSTVVTLLQGSAMGLRILGFAIVGIVLSFFLVRDRDRITEGIVNHLAGREHDDRAHSVLHAAWDALDGYVRASVLVGALEATVIGTTLLIVGTPLAGALTAITFGAAFIPVVGATVAGALAVLVTWVGVGAVEAVIVAVVVLVVQQVDSHVLQPTIVANHTVLHPIATILALLIGGLVGGILGALLAVPTAAVLVAVAGELLRPPASA